MAIFVPRLILINKQFVDKSFIPSKSTSSCCCFFTLRGQGFKNWFQTPKLLSPKYWYSRRKGHGHKGSFSARILNHFSYFPVAYFLPPFLLGLSYILLAFVASHVFFSSAFSTFEHIGSHEIQQHQSTTLLWEIELLQPKWSWWSPTALKFLSAVSNTVAGPKAPGDHTSDAT